MEKPWVVSDAQVLGRINDGLFESTLKEEDDHRKDCAHIDDPRQDCNCNDLNSDDKERYYEDKAIEQYYEIKYGG